MPRGYLIDVQNFSVNDGEGIRTVIFFAGCKLRCLWCSNPESFTSFNKVIHSPKKCIKCGRCTLVCPYGCGIDLNSPINRKKCRGCGKCVEVCPVGSRQRLIKSYEIEEVIEIVDRQRIFYKMSNGGVTYSGGEATMQLTFLKSLVNNFYDESLHQAIETSGYFKYEDVKSIFEKLDTIFIDIKHMDSNKHKYFTGMRNELILENIGKIAKLSKELIIRIPTIIGVNGYRENIIETAKFVYNNVPNPKIELLPYHEYGTYKYDALGLRRPSEKFYTPSSDQIIEFKNLIENQDVEVVSYK